MALHPLIVAPEMIGTCAANNNTRSGLRNMADTLHADQVRFIKLGRKGLWEEGCIDSPSPTLRFGWDNPYHQECLAGNWDIVEQYWRDRNPHEATKIESDQRLLHTG